MAERLAPLGMTWYEEPAGPENADTLRALRERLPGNVSICVGERHYTRHGFRPVLEEHICDIIMPDITRCGGPVGDEADRHDGRGLQRAGRPAQSQRPALARWPVRTSARPSRTFSAASS